jgi:Spy/CpxP family protein refolding chaperone
MKKPLALFSLILFVALMSISAEAQRGGGGGGGGMGGGGNGGGGKSNSSKQSTRDQKTADTSNAELEDLTSRLTLTDPQKAQVKSTLEARDVQLSALKKEKLPKDESKDKSKDIKDAANQKIRAILTPDQQKIFDASTKKGGKKNKEENPDATPATAPAATPAPPAP